MATNKSTNTVMGLLGGAIALAILIFINLVAERAFSRVDLTHEKRYSLSEPFQRILSKLDPKSPAKITYYVSGNPASNFVQTKRDILDKLGEIITASRGMIELDVIDPDRNKRAREELKARGLELNVQQQSQDKLQFSTLFTTLSITYEDQEPVFIPVIQRAEDLEYEIANTFLNMTLEKRPVVALFTPKAPVPLRRTPGARLTPGGFSWILKRQQERFEVKEVELTASSPIPKEAKLLIIISPNNLDERSKYEVTRFLAEGGRVFLISNGWRIRGEMGVDQLLFKTKVTPTGLESYLANLGVKFGSKFVCDVNNVQLPIQSTNLPGAVSHKPLPFYVKIRPENVDQDNPITRFLPGLVMPFPCEMFIDVQKAKKEGIDLSILAQTSQESWTEPFRETIAPGNLRSIPSTFEGKKTVFVKLEGNFPFPYEGQPIPEWPKEPGPDEPDKGTEAAQKKAEKAPPLKRKPGLLLVWSCPDSFNSGYFTPALQNEFLGNLAVIPNVAETATLGDDLIKIRSKRNPVRAIKRLSESKRSLLKLFMLAGMPLLVLAFALIRWTLRRGTQLDYEREFAKTIGPSSFTP